MSRHVNSSSNNNRMPDGSVWSTMRYPIPRGRCMQATGLVSVCPCLRFMAHPLKANTSFECDGCGHHASFHKMRSHEPEVEEAYESSVIIEEQEQQQRNVVVVDDDDDGDYVDDEGTIDGDNDGGNGGGRAGRRMIEGGNETGRKRRGGATGVGNRDGGTTGGKRPRVAKGTRS